MTINNHLLIREMIQADAEIISAAFLQQGWDKPVSQYVQYFQESLAGRRTVLVADYEHTFAGYITICWESTYPPFYTQHIPEIVDFNVLAKYQRRGIGNTLMQIAEQYAAKCSETVGIGVGLTQDYGAAQILYVKRGYIPDGLGISQQSRQLTHGQSVQINDDLVLYFTKKLTATPK